MQKTISRIKNNGLKDIREQLEGNIMLGKEFSNSATREAPMFAELFKWKFSKNPQKIEKKEDKFRLEQVSDGRFLKHKNDTIVWLGHASFFIRIAGQELLIDPIFFNLPGIKRLTPQPCCVDKFTHIKYILLSHNHRDHADRRSIRAILKNNPGAEALLPLSMGKWYGKFSAKYQEAAWWQQYQTIGGVTVYFLPAKHWSRRGLIDYNRMLWGSFIIQGNGKTIYYAGDTGWCEHFTEIAKYFPDIDYALLPIGAYKPEFMMKREHISPNEAVMASNNLNAKNMIPMHYATYDLANEPIGEPLRLLRSNKNLKSNLIITKVGEDLQI